MFIVMVSLACPICEGLFAATIMQAAAADEQRVSESLRTRDVKEKHEEDEDLDSKSDPKLKLQEDRHDEEEKSIKATRMTLVHHQEKDSRSKKLVPRRTS
jgi:hypothetical protein